MHREGSEEVDLGAVAEAGRPDGVFSAEEDEDGSGVVRRYSRAKVVWRAQATTPRLKLRCWKRGQAEQGISASAECELEKNGRR
jgi:hypothetical protein